MKIIKNTTIATIMILGLAVLVPDSTIFAQAADIQRGVNDVGGAGALSFETSLQNIVNTLLFIIGAVSVIMIIYGGFRYVTSGGDASAVKSAKDTIMYAVIGLVVAVLAYSIANFAIGIFDDSDSTSEGADSSSPVNAEPFDRNQFGPTP